ncbi:hypothetical protein [Dietzia sp. CH92]|uniref:hypothetical protein n=1 Tax=Dietzia sp. CH92 TaxID=3051823 RepID=UPI0028D088F6|nr:hypothetical protein [Dietzia sp. CH92]
MPRTPVPAGLPGRVLDALGRSTATLARAVDRRLDALGLAPPPLDLPPGVRDDLREVFAGTVDPARVTIRRGHVPGVPHRRAFALPGLVYLGADPGVVGVPGSRAPDGSAPDGSAPDGSDPDGSDPAAVRPRATPTLVHELVHVWQGRFLGPRYVVRALGEQVRLGRRAYDWRAALERRDAAHGSGTGHGSGTARRRGATRARTALPVEAHAQLVSEAYAARYGPTRSPALSGRDEHLRAVEEVLSGLRAGDASTLRGRTV